MGNECCGARRQLDEYCISEESRRYGNNPKSSVNKSSDPTESTFFKDDEDQDHPPEVSEKPNVNRTKSHSNKSPPVHVPVRNRNRSVANTPLPTLDTTNFHRVNSQSSLAPRSGPNTPRNLTSSLIGFERVLDSDRESDLHLRHLAHNQSPDQGTFGSPPTHTRNRSNPYDHNFDIYYDISFDLGDKPTPTNGAYSVRPSRNQSTKTSASSSPTGSPRYFENFGSRSRPAVDGEVTPLSPISVAS
jgi:hypothetical protein